jgi:transposase
VAGTEHCTAYGYHLHWIRSTQKAEQDAETRERRIEHALERLREIQVKLNTYNLKQRKQIAQRVESILTKGHCRKLIRYEIQATRHYKRIYEKKGRPQKGDSYRTVWSQSFTLTFEVDKDEVRKDEKTDGVFPLITNLDPKDYSAKKALEIYKFQPFLEKRHSQIKTYQEIAPVYLKKSERVVAYLHIHVMALMVASLIERKIRQAMQTESIASLPIYPEDRCCPSPTMFDIVRLFKNVERYEVIVGDELTIFPAELTAIQKKVLELLDVPIADYQ